MQAQNDKKFASLGHRLREVRLQAGWTQSELAQKLGFRKAAVVSRFERNERVPGVETLIILARITTVDLHWLITGQPAPHVTAATEEARRAGARRMANLFEYRDNAMRVLQTLEAAAASGEAPDVTDDLLQDIKNQIIRFQAEIIKEAHPETPPDKQPL